MGSLTTPIFYLHIRSEGCTAEIRLNDAPMLAVVREHEQTALPTVSEWVIHGENLLSVHLYEIGDAPRIRVALCQATLGDVPEPGQELELMVIEWPPAPPPPIEGELPIPIELPGLPLVLTEAGVASQPWGRWAWESSPLFAADARSTAAVISYIRDLHATLAAGSIDALIAQSQLKFNEVAPAYAMTPADATLRVQRAWQGLTSHRNWELAPFDEADLEMRLRCGGRLVEPTTLEGEPILRQRRIIDSESWSMPIFIVRTHRDYTAGELTILR